MTYLHVRWLGAGRDDPVELYSELDADRREVRKVEVFRDGRVGRASSVEPPRTGTRVGEWPVPPAEQIGSDPQFEPRPITREQFEAAWRRRGRVRPWASVG